MARRFSWIANVGFLGGLGVIYYVALRPRLLTAGTLPTEPLRTLPGDEVIVSPNFQATRAINIAAPAAAIWPWIAQMGRDRTGFYGLDSLSNHGLPSAAYLRKDLSDPKIGTALDEGYKVMEIESHQFFLYGSFDLPTPTGDPLEITKLLWLEAAADGATRLIIRTRGYSYGPLSPVLNLVYEVLDYAETSRQLENIKQRAETMVQLQGPQIRLEINEN